MKPATYGSKKLKVPKDFPALLESLALEVLRHQPKDIIQFASNHFTQLLEARQQTPSNPEHAAATIQKHYRGYIERKKFIEQKKAAETIKKRYREHHMKRSQSAAKIQSHYKGFKSRQSEKEVENLLSRADELGLEASATKIQAAYRGYKTRKNLKLSPTDSESHKGFFTSDSNIEESTVKIQAAYRGYRTRKELSDKSKQPDPVEIETFLDDVERAAIIIQKNYKGYLVRKNMQDAV